MKDSPKPSEIILIVSGVLFFIFSFFSWVEISSDEADDRREEIEEQLDEAEEAGVPDSTLEDIQDRLDDFQLGGWNAWGSSPGAFDGGFPGLFPIVTLAALFSLGIAVVIALRRFANTTMPGEIFGFSWPQLYLVVAVYAALVTLSFAILDKQLGEESEEGVSIGAGIGLWLGLLAAIGLVVGAVLAQRDGDDVPSTGTASPPQSF